jgi:hypothetical protein
MSIRHLPLFGNNAKGAVSDRKVRLQEFSSVGRASVSKTEGRGFESPNSCHFWLMGHPKFTCQYANL